MSSNPVRMLMRKVLGTSYELDRLHSAALRHTLASIQDDPEIQAELQARGLGFVVSDSSPDVFVRCNRQGIYIVLRTLIRDSARGAQNKSDVRVATTLTDGNLSVSVSSLADVALAESSGYGSAPEPALLKIVSDMKAGLRRYHDVKERRQVAEVQLQLG